MSPQEKYNCVENCLQIQYNLLAKIKQQKNRAVRSISRFDKNDVIIVKILQFIYFLEIVLTNF